jgi:hypothetical protein
MAGSLFALHGSSAGVFGDSNEGCSPLDAADQCLIQALEVAMSSGAVDRGGHIVGGDIGWKGTRRGREERIGLGKEGITQSPQRNAVVWEKTASVPSDSFSFFRLAEGKMGRDRARPSLR